MGVENKKDRLRAKFVLAFIGMKTFPGEVHRYFGCFHGEFRFLERMHRIGNFQRDVLSGAALLVLITAARDNGVGEAGLRSVIFYGQT